MKSHSGLLEGIKNRRKLRSLSAASTGNTLIKLLVSAGLLLALIGVVFLALQPKSQSFALVKEEAGQENLAAATTPEAPVDAGGNAAAVATTAPEATIVVYVSGAVANPAVYELPEGSRVNDAVLAAGGLQEDAAAGYVNLAQPLTDGQQVNIPSLADAEAGALPTPVLTDPAQGSVGGAGTQAPELININTASKEQLETLPGIGTVTAERIIAYRTANGAFAQKTDLKKVSGIGDKKYAAIADLICV